MGSLAPALLALAFALALTLAVAIAYALAAALALCFTSLYNFSRATQSGVHLHNLHWRLIHC